MKKLFVCAALLCLWAAGAPAVDFGALKPEGYVSDFARVMDPAGRQRLEQYGAELERSTGVQIALVTLPSLSGEPVEDIANTLFRKWGIGKKGQDNGLLLLLSIQDRRSRLEVGYGLEPIITDGDAGEILRAMRPYLRAQQYGDALLAAANEIGTRIARAKGVALEAPAPRTPRRAEPQAHVPIGLFVGGIFLFFLLSSLIGGRRGPRGGGGFGGFLPGLILGNLLGRSIGYRSGGGGFGGFDSSDGFGGFGGGDSGGGGASSDW